MDGTKPRWCISTVRWVLDNEGTGSSKSKDKRGNVTSALSKEKLKMMNSF